MMMSPNLVLGVALGGALLVASSRAPGPASGDVAERVRQYTNAMSGAYAKVRDYTTIFHKRERVGGELQPAERIELKFRKPLAVYLAWTREAHAGQELIYVAGWNGGKLRAHKGSFPDLTVNLAPRSALAMKGNRHPVTEVGFGHTIAIIAADVRRSEAHPEDGTRYLDLGESTVYGAASRCVEQQVPAAAAASYYAARALICFDVRTYMPTRVTTWDGEGRLVEDYGYERTRLDVGLDDLDFDPRNPAYRF